MSSDVSVGVGEALVRLLESLAEPLIPTSLNAACRQATSKDQGFEVSGDPPVPRHFRNSRRRKRMA